MGRYINSFEVDLPALTADLYAVDPQPEGDKFAVLNAHTEALEAEVRGLGHWYRLDDEYYVAIIGANRREKEKIPSSGAELTFTGESDLDPSSEQDFDVIEQALTKGLKWYLESYHDYWYDSVRKTFYEDDTLTTIEGFALHPGMAIRFGYHDRPLFTLDSTIGLIGTRTLAEYLEDWGLERVKAEFVGESFIQDGPDRRSCRVGGIFSDVTVSDPSPDPWNDPVIDFIDSQYGKEWADRVDPDEPLVKIRYNRNKWYPAAPSLLYPSPGENRPDSVSQRAAKPPRERWNDIEEFLEVIGHIQMESEEAPISQSPIRDGLGGFDYPVLTFGQEPSTEMAIGRRNISLDHSPILEPRYWNPAKEGYLEKVGPRDTFDEEVQMAVLHANGAETEAERVYEDIRDYTERYTGVHLSERIGRVNFENERELEEWTRTGRENVQAGFAYLPDYDEDTYHRLISLLDGRPLQSLTATELAEKRRTGNESDVLTNTAIGLGVKLGVVPFTIENQLTADAYLGLSVTGHETKVASAVLISGEDGRIIYQSTEPRPSGRSTVTSKGIAIELLREAVQEATASDHITGDRLDSLVIHRNGFLGKDEQEGLREGVDLLREYDYVSDSFEWAGVNIMGNTPHRIFDDDGMPDMGSHAILDDETIVIVTTDTPQLDQGTPQPLFCEVAVSDGQFGIQEIGRDVFLLSELNWAAPSKGIKNPLTVYLTRRMNRRLSHDRVSKLTYPPF